MCTRKDALVVLLFRCIVLSWLYQPCWYNLATGLTMSLRLLQVVNRLFKTSWHIGTSHANTTCRNMLKYVSVFVECAREIVISGTWVTFAKIRVAIRVTKWQNQWCWILLKATPFVEGFLNSGIPHVLSMRWHEISRRRNACLGRTKVWWSISTKFYRWVFNDLGAGIFCALKSIHEARN